MDNSRKIAVKVLNEVFDKGEFSNKNLNIRLINSDLDSKDKALVTEIVYGTIKYRYTIDRIIDNFLKEGIKKLDTTILNILRISIYQMKYLDKIPDFAAVNEGVNLAKAMKSVGMSKLVNGVLRNYLRNKEERYCDDRDIVSNLCYDYSFPKWMVKTFIDQYGEDTATKILEGLNKRPAVTVRVNSLKGDFEEVFDLLEENEYSVSEGYICPEAIRIEKGRSIEKNPLFKDGLITVQDESAMLVAPSMDLEEGMTVLDLCSAPGGKTTHIAELLDNNGKVYAFDLQRSKLPLVEENAERLGATIVQCDKLNAEIFNEKLVDLGDRVLIDVPCSGLGIIRKKPEIKWNKSKNQLDALVQMQRRIMTNACKYVKQGGYLIYSTCTLNKDENEKNINWFLLNHSGFKVESLNFGKAENIIYNKDGSVTILPNDYMDGFFICKIKKL